MFSQASVSHSIHRGGGGCMPGGYACEVGMSGEEGWVFKGWIG